MKRARAAVALLLAFLLGAAAGAVVATRLMGPGHGHTFIVKRVPAPDIRPVPKI